MKEVIGFTTGVFDLFHIGHLNMLKEAARHCDKLIVAVSSDELVRELKGIDPVIPFEERVEIVGSIDCVWKAVQEQKDDKIHYHELYKFDKIFKGDDWKGSTKWNLLEDKFKTLNVQVKYFPYTKSTSSTLMREVLHKIKG